MASQLRKLRAKIFELLVKRGGNVEVESMTPDQRDMYLCLFFPVLMINTAGAEISSNEALALLGSSLKVTELKEGKASYAGEPIEVYMQANAIEQFTKIYTTMLE